MADCDTAATRVVWMRLGQLADVLMLTFIGMMSPTDGTVAARNALRGRCRYHFCPAATLGASATTSAAWKASSARTSRRRESTGQRSGARTNGPREATDPPPPTGVHA